MTEHLLLQINNHLYTSVLREKKRLKFAHLLWMVPSTSSNRNKKRLTKGFNESKCRSIILNWDALFVPMLLASCFSDWHLITYGKMVENTLYWSHKTCGWFVMFISHHNSGKNSNLYVHLSLFLKFICKTFIQYGTEETVFVVCNQITHVVVCVTKNLAYILNAVATLMFCAF